LDTNHILSIATTVFTVVLIPMAGKIWSLVSKIAIDIAGIHVELQAVNGRIKSLEEVHPRGEIHGK